jgi:tetratricopeptide (TPR) repeat protein
LNAALRVDGDTADIYNDRGRVNTETGDLAAACADYEAAARLRPAWSRPHSNRGWALVLAGDLDQALRAFARALALDPADALAVYGRRAVAVRRGEITGEQAGTLLINDPEIARMVAASGVPPIADLGDVPSLEP